MKKFRLPLFYKIYFVVLLFLVAFLCLFSVWFNGVISAYNERIPETISRRFFEDMFVNKNVPEIVKMSGITPCEFETDTDMENFILDYLSEELSYANISSNSDDETKRYIVKKGDYKIASFALKIDENGEYFPCELKLHISGQISKTYKLLDTSELKINGVVVSPDYITEIVPHKNSAYLPDNVPAPRWATYTVSGLTKEPCATVTDRNRNSPQLIETDGIYTEEIIYDTQDPEITQLLLNAARQYAMCMQHDATKASVLVYYERGTDLYKSIQSVLNIFALDHSGYGFEDEQTTEFMRYDKNTVSLRISFTHILKMYGKKDYRDITDITFFARNIDGEYKIFAQINN
ncbi:MAG: hypothetical protein IJO74_00665 [Clostridia bacterium]|nr:hypothetical protein [Clostridia bacterium]